MRAATVVAFALAAAALLTALPAQAATGRHPVITTISHRDAHRVVDGRFVIRNDVFGPAPEHETITNVNLWANFIVTRSTARSRTSEAWAFPDIFYGCAWNTCSPGTRLPLRVSSAMRARATWSIRARAGGLWNAAYDLWLMRSRHISGQAHGAEIMIWLRTSYVTPPGWRPVVRIDGTRWYFQTWRACVRPAIGTVVPATGQPSGCWRYVQFRRVVPTDYVRNLPLGPFFAFAERHRLASPRWWFTSIEAGFEIWRGGLGLATLRFRASI
jgi:Glycosyl hydrolase family 12